MPSDSNLDKIPPSPIDDDDLWLINREDNSYKVTSKMLGSYLISSPIPETCEENSDCPPDRLCVDGFCERIPCDSEQPPGQEGCPPDYVCIADHCYPNCDPTQPSPCGEDYVCVDPGVTGGDYVCLPYPFPCRPDILPDDGCPPGYTCWGGNCYQTCSDNSTCPPGMECVEFQDPDSGVGYICVPSSGGFPCVDGQCPNGYDCFFGMCFAKCGDPNDPNNSNYPNGGVCEEGFHCLDIDGIDYCVPYPFPCDLYSPGCPDGMVCYHGECFPECDSTQNDACEDGFQCLEIGGGITICYPDFPQEGFVNDGPLVIRTEPLGYPDVPASEKIVFTANQYGRSVLTFQGFAQNPGGPGGGDCSQGQSCPPGYSCVGGICILTPCDSTGGITGGCPIGTICFAGHCYKPCDITKDKPCDPGFECVEVTPGLTLCLPGGETGGGKCDDGKCPAGYECTTIDGEKYCVPVSCSDRVCPDGQQCFNGFCYKPCGGIGGGLCDENFVCVEIPAIDDSLCMPIGGGGSGGGSGGDINIIIDPGWWNPDENTQSPIGNGILILKDKEGDIVPLFTANQFANSIFSMNHLDIIPPGSGTPCNSDNDCPPGEFCGNNGKCVTGSGDGCSLSSDCPVGEVCIDGKCYGNGTDGGNGNGNIGGGNCSANGDCPSDAFVCLDGVCVQKPCPPGGCGTGQVCYGGFCYELCVPGTPCADGHHCITLPDGTDICYPIGGGGGGGEGGLNGCTEDAQCIATFECDNGICTPRPCSDSSACLNGYCYQGQCFPMCNNGSCPNGYECVEIIDDGGGTETICLPLGNNGGGGISGDINVEINQYHDSKWEFVTPASGPIRPKDNQRHVIPNGNTTLGTVNTPWTKMYIDEGYVTTKLEPKGNSGTGTIGTSNKRFSAVYATNLYTYDLNLSNESTEGNDVDGTTGSWTIQEGKDDLFLINRITGKRYKFKLEGVD